MSRVQPTVIQGSYTYSSGLGRPQKLFGILYLKMLLWPASSFHFNTLFLTSNSLTQLYLHQPFQSSFHTTRKSKRDNEREEEKKKKTRGYQLWSQELPLCWQLYHELPILVDLSAQELRLQWGKIAERRNHCLTLRLWHRQAEIQKVLELEATEK